MKSYLRLTAFAILLCALTFANHASGQSNDQDSQSPPAVVDSSASAEAMVRLRSPQAAGWQDYLTGNRLMAIGLARRAQEVSLVCNGSFKIFVNGVLLRSGAAGEVVTFSGEMNERLTLVPEPGKLWFVKVNGRPLSGVSEGKAAFRYPGKLDIFASPGCGGGDQARVTLVDRIPLEQYVCGVIEEEMPSSFPLEALRAQAICARTYALFYLGRHQADGFDLCASTHCQVYNGKPDRYSSPVAAAFSTRGQVLLYDGQPAGTFFHSTCGGETADGRFLAENTRDRPYLVGVSDLRARTVPYDDNGLKRFLAGGSEGYCRGSRKYRWTVTLSAAEVDTLVQANLGKVLGQPSLQPGKVKMLRIASRERARVKVLTVECAESSYDVEGNNIRWLFKGASQAKGGLMSTMFTMSVGKDAAGNLQYTFVGGGWGHGVGMCQFGAQGRAQAGQSAAEILAAYFPGAELWNQATQASEVEDE